MQVEIDNDTALNMLVDRVKSWTSDSDTIDLFAKMYEHYIDGDYDISCENVGYNFIEAVSDDRNMVLLRY